MKIIEKTFNAETGEETIIERDETADEKKERETFLKEVAARKAQSEAIESARQEILNKLGLTADEAKLLLG